MSKRFVIVFIIIIMLATIGDVIASDKKVSEIEKRPLQQFPKFELDDYFDGNFSNDLNKYVEDQFFMKNGLRNLKSWISYNIFKNPINNNIYIIDKNMYEKVYPIREYGINKFKKTIQHLIDNYGLEDVYIVPDKSMYLNKYLYINEIGDIFDDYNFMYDYLSNDDYYKTDLHLTHKGAYELYKSIVDNPFDVNFEKVSDNFQGYYFNKSMYLGIKDEIYKSTNEIIDDLSICILDKCSDSVFFKDNLLTRDKYKYFIDGTNPITKIHNPKGEGDLVLFTDSYGQSASIFLAQHYETVTVVDLRLVDLNTASKYIPEGAKTIALYGLKTINDASISSIDY